MFANDGSSAFDSRLQTQRIFLVGTLDLQGRTSSPAPGGGVLLNPSAFTNVPYGKTFDKIPYVRSVSRRIGTSNAFDFWIQPPYINYSAGGNYLTYINGHYSNANTTSLYIGNTDATDAANGFNGARRYWYAVFENPVE